ncbi:MAG: cytochrome P450 [Myxococcota bacterium]
MVIRTRRTESEGRLPPGPRFAPLQTARYMRDPYGYTRWLRDRYGDVVTMPAMNGRLVMSMTAEGARAIMDTPTHHFGEFFGADALRPVLGEESLFLLTGRRHRSERKLLSPAFHGQRMRSLATEMQQVALDRSAGWTEGLETTLLDEMQAISLEVILRVVLGVESEARREPLRIAITHAVNEANPVLFFFRALQRDFGGFGPWARFKRHRDVLRQLLADEIVRARREANEDRADILARLVRAKDDEGNACTDESIRDHLITLLIAGHETTASALSWTLYELDRNPDVCKWLLAEIGALGAEADPKDLAGLPALEATAREGLRLHPIVAELFRPVLCPTPFLGYVVPAGAILAASILEIHQDASLYPEPERFMPARFLERRFAPNEFAAFGAGHRFCLGSAFALVEMSVVIGTLLPRYRFRVAPGDPLGVGRRNVTLPPERGAPVVIERR